MKPAKPKRKALWMQMRPVAPPKPRRRIAAVSARRRKLMTEYNRLRDEWLPRGRELHHQRGRNGTLLIDQRFWLVVTSEIHRKIHDNPEWARREGWLCAKGDWNRAPQDAETERLRRRIAEVCK